MKKFITLILILFVSVSSAEEQVIKPPYADQAGPFTELTVFRWTEDMYPFQAAFAGLIAVGNVREIRENEIDLYLKNIWCGETTNQFVTIPFTRKYQRKLFSSSTNGQDYIFFLSTHTTFNDVIQRQERFIGGDGQIIFHLEQYRDFLPQIPLQFFRRASWIPINEDYSQVIPWVSNLVDAAQIHPNRERFVEILCNSRFSTNLLIQSDSRFFLSNLDAICSTNLIEYMWLNNTNLTPQARNYLAGRYRNFTGVSLPEKHPDHEPQTSNNPE